MEKFTNGFTSSMKISRAANLTRIEAAFKIVDKIFVDEKSDSLVFSA